MKWRTAGRGSNDSRKNRGGSGMGGSEANGEGRDTSGGPVAVRKGGAVAADGGGTARLGKKRRAGKGKHIFYLLLATSMLVYASTGIAAAADGAARAFWLVWLAFSALILAANVNVLLMTDEKRDRLARLKRFKWQQWERGIEKRLLKRYETKARRGVER